MSEQTQSGRISLGVEPCRFCGTSSEAMHPAGVIKEMWLCTRCDRWQSGEEPGNQVEES